MHPLIVFCAKYLFVAVGALAIAAWLKTANSLRWQFILTAILSGIVAVALTKIAGSLYYHPRPYIAQHIQPLITGAPTDNGFPSDHTVLCMTLTAVIFFYKRQLAALAFALTLLVGSARVLAHVHSPLDILGGLLIGATAGVVGAWFARKIKPAKA
jgi:membrane-associated phospholipid phosphatase